MFFGKYRVYETETATLVSFYKFLKTKMANFRRKKCPGR